MADARLRPWAKMPAPRKKMLKPGQHKMNARKTEVDGIVFDSKREAGHYQELKALERAGKIQNLRLQVAYELVKAVVLDGKRRPARKAIIDFVYEQDGKVVHADSKGMKTPVYTLKRHLMKAVHGIEIKEL